MNFFLTLLLLIPGVASAQTFNGGFDGLDTLLKKFTSGVITTTGYMLLTLATVAFFFGVVQFIWAARQGAEGKGISNGKNFMKWGLIALFVMFSVWGIIKFAQGVFQIQTDNVITVPSLCFGVSGTTNCPTAQPKTTPSSAVNTTTDTSGTKPAVQKRGAIDSSKGNQGSGGTTTTGDTPQPSAPKKTVTKETTTTTTKKKVATAPQKAINPAYDACIGSGTQEAECAARYPTVSALEARCLPIAQAVSAKRSARQALTAKDIDNTASCVCEAWGGDYTPIAGNAGANGGLCGVPEYGEVNFSGDSAPLNHDIEFLTMCTIMFRGTLQNRTCVSPSGTFTTNEQFEEKLIALVCENKLKGRTTEDGSCVDASGEALTLSIKDVCSATGAYYDKSSNTCLSPTAAVVIDDVAPIDFTPIDTTTSFADGGSGSFEAITNDVESIDANNPVCKSGTDGKSCILRNSLKLGICQGANDTLATMGQTYGDCVLQAKK